MTSTGFGVSAADLVDYRVGQRWGAGVDTRRMPATNDDQSNTTAPIVNPVIWCYFVFLDR